MGYERKRGKLAALNSFLRGGARDQFSVVTGDTMTLSSVRYVITLDTDTQLPRDAAAQFIGAMAHPLNRPRFDKAKGRVVEGYGILQPRVAVSLPGSSRSRYAKMWGSDPGIDPYTRAVSDLYQDLFRQGSFIGKGIYDVDAFEQALANRFPENQILSHDLLEGCYARAGFLSDVQLFEDYPSRYSADVSRRHRWIRGDWQLGRWILPGVPGAATRMQRNPLSGLSRWKLFDNLRRSLVPAALVFLLLLGWTVAPSALFWTLSVIGILLIPSLAASSVGLWRKPDDVFLKQHLGAALRGLRADLIQVSFTLACLPYEAWFSLDAILRTLWRTLFSRKHLLEWNPSSESDLSSRTNLTASWRTMWIAPALAMASAVYLMRAPATLSIAAPVLCMWFASPLVAWWISRPLARRQPKLTQDQTVFLRKISRKTWAFFETFVGPDDHWLPPDNYQENPAPVIGHRTSPTNMGLALLANLSSHDFGYISAGLLIARTSNTLRTMSGLERYRGHFYNWYDTLTLKPMPPVYVSTVDSGNLAGHLLTLRAGLLALPDQPILGSRFFEGLRDAAGILRDVTKPAVPEPLLEFEKQLPATLDSVPFTLSAVRDLVDNLVQMTNRILLGLPIEPATDVNWWANALALQCRDAYQDLLLLAPSGVGAIPTLRQLAAAELESNAENRPAGTRIASIDQLALECADLARMEYGFLFDKANQLLAIGYNVSECRRDASFYDLLASEARLCSFVAIAQGQLPQENWFALGRLLTTAGGEPVLVSWSGSMFEYLMPLLVMPTYENTLLDQTCKAAVKRQIEYGGNRSVAWGISESGYNAVDAQLNYQYRAFGVPGLGLKRGLAEDLVIAPYASALALMVAPEAACQNLQRLAGEGFEGRYGFYEAIDYTPSRLPRGQANAIVRSFMVHHQGMSFLSLAYLLLDRPMQKRFEADPQFQATMLLLQERVPKATAVYSHTSDATGRRMGGIPEQAPMRVLTNPDTATPQVQLLSNGRYNVMVTNAGGGYSRWKNIAVTRWREDATCDNWGTFCYVRDLASGDFWSTAYQPALKPSDEYEAIFSEARAEFRRRDRELDTHTEIAVSSEDDIELRRISITNRSRTHRLIDVTTYAEVVLAASAADQAHPAFSNLFVQTEIIGAQKAILCTRRPRSENEQSPWMFHLVAVHGAEVAQVSYETDRMQFIGRGNTSANPDAMRNAGPLSGSQGSVLDPIVAIRHRITLKPEQTAIVDVVSGMSDTREVCVSLVEKYQDRRLADRVFDLAWTHSHAVLRQINTTEAEAQLYARLGSSIVYSNPTMRADAGILLQNHRGQSGLWGYSISGDFPIVLLHISDSANIDLVRQLVQAHAYWRLKGLSVDLVIWNEDHAGYRQELHEQIMGLIAAGVETSAIDRPGGIFVRAADQMSNEDRILVQTVARAIIVDSRGTLAEQVNRKRVIQTPVPKLAPTRVYRPHTEAPASFTYANELLFFNGRGGFTPDGREYIINTAPGQVTPAPWVNVMANSQFGAVVSESGVGYTWAENAHEFRVTPWQNDPVSDSSGEAFYLRDEETGHFWSPSPLPARGTTPYVSRHGFGYSVFEHSEDGIHSETWIYVAVDAPVKFTVLKVRNDSDRPRRLSATGYAEWVLGDLRSKSAMHIVTEIDPASGALFARNPYNTEFAGRCAFFHVDDTKRTISGNRAEFLGRNGTQQHPAAMDHVRLSGNIGAGWDPCAAIQVSFELLPGQEREIVFRLGVGRDAEDSARLVQRFKGSMAAHHELETVWEFWKHTLGAVHVETPDPALNVLANGWLMYQTLGCRFWGRSGYYQSGGAFGYRDQLQDAMALVHNEPHLLRQHLLLCASHQFIEGDVQHWWHPPAGRGVRTHCSDDFLWLPLAVCRYVMSTGDTGVLDEQASFLQGRPVGDAEDSYYDLPTRPEVPATLYEHCVRAIQKGLATGEHGLPLMGSGDWNDGMNLVGEHGKGESIWLAFFLYHVLTQFTGIARLNGDVALAEQCESEAAKLRLNVEKNGWDGEWYRRAYFDDGSPLGSSVNEECRIDSIAQSWSVLSGAGDSKRARMGMDSLDKYLVRREHSLVQLLDPPFDKSSLNPGYIKGYVPGVRENGGQYTHAAIWATMAFAALGDHRRAWDLFTMINPVNHARDPQSIATYKVEPYVVAADVYAQAPHIGRGGWTWYTGSAGWMYRLIVESLLGLRLEVDKLYFTPCVPPEWNGFQVHYRYRETIYHIDVLQVSGSKAATAITMDDVELEFAFVPLVDDRIEHSVQVRYRRDQSDPVIH